MRGLRKLVLYGLLFVAVAVAGFALGGCGGGGGGAISGEVSLPSVTRTAPARTQPSATTSVVTQTTTVQQATTAESSSSSTPWGWIALGLALAAGLLIGLLLWHRHRAGAREWGGQTADLNRRALIALDDVLAKGSVVTGQIQALAAEAQALEARAPDDTSRAAAAHVRERLDELAATLESDRALRLASPPPSAEQLSYSDALIRQQAEQLQGALRVPSSSAPPP